MSTINSRVKAYSDLDFSLRINPNTGDVGLKKDVAAVKQSVINILMTRKGERPFNHYLGGDIHSYLFEHFDNVIGKSIENRIINTLNNFEPRVEVKQVKVQDLSHRNALNIWMELVIKSPDSITTEIEFTVERLR